MAILSQIGRILLLVSIRPWSWQKSAGLRRRPGEIPMKSPHLQSLVCKNKLLYFCNCVVCICKTALQRRTLQSKSAKHHLWHSFGTSEAAAFCWKISNQIIWKNIRCIFVYWCTGREYWEQIGTRHYLYTSLLSLSLSLCTLHSSRFASTKLLFCIFSSLTSSSARSPSSRSMKISSSLSLSSPSASLAWYELKLAKIS